MAIYGAGSNWDGDELKEEFFANDNFAIGWNYEHAKDLYDGVSLLKAGDIIYLKANRGGSRSIRVKGIGVVTKSFIHNFIDSELKSGEISDWNGFYIQVKWIIKDEFHVSIPEKEGKLTNIRSATFYEEHLPYVQNEILKRLFKFNYKHEKNMDYGIGQFVTGVISVGFQVLQLWIETRDIKVVQNKVRQFDEITNSQEVLSEGLALETLIPNPTLNTLKGRVEICWTDFDDAVGNPNITPRQLDRYADGLRECICRELKVIRLLNGKLPNQKMQDWWNQYKCES